MNFQISQIFPNEIINYIFKDTYNLIYICKYAKKNTKNN